MHEMIRMFYGRALPRLDARGDRARHECRQLTRAAHACQTTPVRASDAGADLPVLLEKVEVVQVVRAC